MNKIKTHQKKYTHIVILCLLFSFFLNGQYDSVYLPFIKSNANRLYFSNDSQAFAAFSSKLNGIKNGDNKRVNIVHIGGSHVQGGTWSNAFVSAFQNRFNTKGGGYFVFPYKIAKTNGQPYAGSFSNGKWKRCRAVGKEFCLPLGLCAMNVNTNDSANNFGVYLTKFASCREVNTIRVYHNFNKSFEFRLSTPDSVKVERKDMETIGYSQFRLAAATDSVCFELIKKDTLQKDFTLYGISMENDTEPGFYLAGLGANGASSVSFLRCMYLVPQLQSLQADAVLLSLGVNDTQSKGFEKDEYIEHYDSLITHVKNACPGALIVLTTTSDNFIRRKTSNKRSITARQAMFELMEKHQVAVWDLFTVMGGYKSMYKWYKAGLAARDKVHFTMRGYTIIGNLMFDAFLKSYNTYPKTY